MVDVPVCCVNVQRGIPLGVKMVDQCAIQVVCNTQYCQYPIIQINLKSSVYCLLTGAKSREWMGLGVAGVIIDSYCGSFPKIPY